MGTGLLLRCEMCMSLCRSLVRASMITNMVVLVLQVYNARGHVGPFGIGPGSHVSRAREITIKRRSGFQFISRGVVVVAAVIIIKQ